MHRPHEHAVLEGGKTQIERGEKIGILGHEIASAYGAIMAKPDAPVTLNVA
ncbi:hypothetical protein RCCS2_07484 [Roseobacter sp. CCS2]|nr:hypothetical protein RCCS2_07484 [Roseobacter sp. CCS2]